MNKDIYNIFESYTKKLSLAAAKSGAGLPIAQMPLDEDDEGFTPDQVSKIIFSYIEFINKNIWKK